MEVFPKSASQTWELCQDAEPKPLTQPNIYVLSSCSVKSHQFKITKLPYPLGTKDLGGKRNYHQPLPKIPG